MTNLDVLRFSDHLSADKSTVLLYSGNVADDKSKALRFSGNVTDDKSSALRLLENNRLGARNVCFPRDCRRQNIPTHLIEYVEIWFL